MENPSKNSLINEFNHFKKIQGTPISVAILQREEEYAVEKLNRLEKNLSEVYKDRAVICEYLELIRKQIDETLECEDTIL